MIKLLWINNKEIKILLKKTLKTHHNHNNINKNYKNHNLNPKSHSKIHPSINRIINNNTNKNNKNYNKNNINYKNNKNNLTQFVYYKPKCYWATTSPPIHINTYHSRYCSLILFSTLPKFTLTNRNYCNSLRYSQYKTNPNHPGLREETMDLYLLTNLRNILIYIWILNKMRIKE